MRPRTPKRAAQERIYRRRRLVFLKDRRCEFPPGCVLPAVEVHHRKGRIGALLLDEAHWSGLCSPHHAWVTLNPTAALAMGISERRLGAVS